MFQKYYSNNIESKFIKELLRTTYIPTVQIWKKGMKILAGLTYIADGYIVKCKIDSEGKDENGNYVPNTIYETNDEEEPYFEIIEPYVVGKFYRGITTNFVSNSSLYDPKTHYYLGEYLRMIRDLYNIDLMPYYNCWDGRYSDNLRIKYLGEQTIYKSIVIE